MRRHGLKKAVIIAAAVVLAAARPSFCAQLTVVNGLLVNGAATLASSATVNAPLGIGVLRTSYGENRDLTPAAAAQYGGIYSSTHVYVDGNIYTGVCYGDGSGLSNVVPSPAGSSLASANIWVGNAINQAAEAAMGGEGSLSNTGAFTLSRSIAPAWTGEHTFSSVATFSNAQGINTPKAVFATNVELSSAAAANYGGVYVSTHIYAAGNFYAVKLYGDGAGLSGIEVPSIAVSTINATATTPYGGVNITTNVFINGGVRLAKQVTQAADSGITLTSADFGKTITVNSASARVVYLPAVTAADIGATVTVVKLGAGRVTIDAPAGAYIADSASGGTIYNSAANPAYATITLRLVTDVLWLPVEGLSSWVKG